jgi:SOS-response transcriptional repressor LexA
MSTAWVAASSWRRRQVIAAVEQFVAEHGYGPSVREVARMVGLSSSHTAYMHLRNAARDGELRHEKRGQSRAYYPIATTHCPTCHRPMEKAS